MSYLRLSHVTRVMQMFTLYNVFEDTLGHIILPIYATKKLPIIWSRQGCCSQKDGPSNTYYFIKNNLINVIFVGIMYVTHENFHD